MNNYQRIARVIRYLDHHHTEQPDLAELAACAGLSPFHFHRLFSTWAGITPKDFLQCLTMTNARELLRRGENVLEAALQAGLSGPGRLHDLCVSLESASPGEMKNGGAGWIIKYGFTDSPFGLCLIGIGPRGICRISFHETEDAREALSGLQADWPVAKLQRDDRSAIEMAQRIFTAPTEMQAGPLLRAFVRGTPFQVMVWRALLQIGPGRLTSYGQLARAIGHPGAARAVGTAVGRNPLAYLIPCHRVIRETGALGGYHWGLERKRAMLAREICDESLDRPDPGLTRIR